MGYCALLVSLELGVQVNRAKSLDETAWVAEHIWDGVRGYDFRWHRYRGNAHTKVPVRPFLSQLLHL